MSAAVKLQDDARPAVGLLIRAFDEAIAWHLSRLVMTDDEVAQLMANARNQAFWIANVAQLRLVQDVFDEISKGLQQGLGYAEFSKAMAGKLARAWGGANPARVEVIWRTAIQTAYNAGRWRQMEQPAVKRFRPFRMYDAVLDSRTTPYCRDRDGIVKPADDNWWNTNWPPLHYNCRSGVRSLTPRQAMRKGIAPAGLKIPDAQGSFGNSPRAAGFANWRPEPKGYDTTTYSALIAKAEKAGPDATGTI